MTPRQKECLDFISKFWKKHGYAPSYDNIKDALGAKSKSSVAALVTKLEGRGYIQRTPNLARSIRVIASKTTPLVVEVEETPVPTPTVKTKNKAKTKTTKVKPKPVSNIVWS